MGSWLRLRSPEDRWRAFLWLGLLGVLAVTAYRYNEKIHKPSRGDTYTRSAFLRWRDQIGDLDRGVDIYRKYNYPNPPVQALVLMPLTRLDRFAGALSWFALKVVMAGAAWVWAVRLCREGGRPVPVFAKGVAALFALHPLHGDLSHGNVNIFIAFLVLGSLELFRRRWDVSAGVVLALAIACKVTPALFLPYFVWKRAWRTVLGTLAGCVLWLAVVPGAVLGWEYNRTLLVSWFDEMVRPFLIDGKVTSEHANQSIPGLTVRLLTDAPSDVDYDEDDRPVPKRLHTVVNIGPANARLVVRACQAGYVLLGVLLLRARVRGPTDPREGLRVAAEFSFVILGMLLFSERTWKHHGTVLILPFLVAAAFYSARALPRWVRAGLAGANGVIFLLMAGPSLLGEDAQDAALAYGSHTAVFLILLAEVSLILWWEGRGAAGSGLGERGVLTP